VLPKKLQIKKILEEPKIDKMDNKIITPEYDPEETICCICEQKLSGNKFNGAYVVLFKREKVIKPIDGKCLNAMGLSNELIYSESMKVYHKRRKVGFYKDWKVHEKD
jgi:hypothetical protein